MRVENPIKLCFGPGSAARRFALRSDRDDDIV
jgi:hypothetical protein